MTHVDMVFIQCTVYLFQMHHRFWSHECALQLGPEGGPPYRYTCNKSVTPIPPSFPPTTLVPCRNAGQLDWERAAKVIEEMMKLNPMFTPPPDFVKSKPHRKLYIPTDEYPGYNFIGKGRTLQFESPSERRTPSFGI